MSFITRAISGIFEGLLGGGGSSGPAPAPAPKDPAGFKRVGLGVLVPDSPIAAPPSAIPSIPEALTKTTETVLASTPEAAKAAAPQLAAAQDVKVNTATIASGKETVSNPSMGTTEVASIGKKGAKKSVKVTRSPASLLGLNQKTKAEDPLTGLY